MTSRPNVLDIANIIRILPHKPPAVAIDAVVELHPGRKIVATKSVSVSDPCLSGHFPGLPIYPAAMLLEAMLQACTVLAYVTEKFDSSKEVVTLVGVNKTKFRRTIIPGDMLEIDAKLTQRRSNVWRFDVVCYVDDYIVAESGLVLSIHNREDII